MPNLNLDFGDGVSQPSTPEGTPSSAPVDITGATTKPGEVDITNQDGKTTPTEPTNPATPKEPATPSEPTTPPTTPTQPTDTNPSTGGSKLVLLLSLKVLNILLLKTEILLTKMVKSLKLLLMFKLGLMKMSKLMIIV